MDVSSSERVRSAAGLTLLELLIAVALFAIVTTLAVPAFHTLSAEQRLVTAVNRLVGHLHLARSQAVRSQVPAILCPSSGGKRCDRTNRWHRGWILFSDSNNNAQRDAGEPVLRRQEAIDGIRLHSGARSYRVRYRSNGMSYFSNTTFTFCGTRGAEHARAVILSNTGRPRTAREGPGGRALTCSAG